VIKNSEDLHCRAVEKGRKEKLTAIEDGGYKSLICKRESGKGRKLTPRTEGKINGYDHKRTGSIKVQEMAKR
jgi:hypothetical protein